MYGSYRPRRRWLRWFFVYAGCTLAVAVIGLVIEAAISAGPRQPQTFSPAIPTLPLAPGTRPTATPRAFR